MARFLFCSYAQEGHLHPALAVAKTLAARGHTVGYLTAPHKADTIRRQGIEYLEPTAWSAGLPENHHDLQSPGLIGMIKIIREGFRDSIFPDALKQIEDLDRVQKTFKADIVVGSQVTYGVPIFAKRHGLTWATHCILPTFPFNSRDQFPWGMGRGLPRNGMQRFEAKVSRAVSRQIVRPLIHEWRQTVAKLGVNEPHQTDLVGFNLSPDLFTVPSAPGFDLPRSDMPPQVRYVGTCLFNEGAEAEWENPFGDDKPLIYASAGTLFMGPEFYQRAIAAAAGQPWNMLAVIGRGVDPASYGPLPPNVKLEAYVPQNPVMKKAAAVLCHGGGGTIMSGLAHDLPIVAVPFASDQPENALRVARLGAGFNLSRVGCTPEKVRDAVNAVLTQPQYREAAARFGKVARAHDGGVNAANELEKLAQRRASS